MPSLKGLKASMDEAFSFRRTKEGVTVDCFRALEPA
jgi:hypothetical protein